MKIKAHDKRHVLLVQLTARTSRWATSGLVKIPLQRRPLPQDAHFRSKTLPGSVALRGPDEGFCLEGTPKSKIQRDPSPKKETVYVGRRCMDGRGSGKPIKETTSSQTRNPLAPAGLETDAGRSRAPASKPAEAPGLNFWLICFCSRSPAPSIRESLQVSPWPDPGSTKGNEMAREAVEMATLKCGLHDFVRLTRFRPEFVRVTAEHRRCRDRALEVLRGAPPYSWGASAPKTSRLGGGSPLT